MAKIQVQGIGVYDDKTLKKKIIDMANNLSKLAKKGEWSKSSENGIRALGRMWGAYQDWSRKNESVNESKTSNMMKAIRKHGTSGPWDIIVSKNNKIVKRVSVQNLKEIPAEMADVKKKYPNHKIGIEAKSGNIAYRESVNEGPDADLGKKLKQIQNQIYKLGHQYKSKANVPAMMRSFMLGVQNQLKKDKLTEGPQRDMNVLADYIIDLNIELSNAKILAKKHPKYKKYIKFIQQDIKDANSKLEKIKKKFRSIKLKSKSGMGTISHLGMPDKS